MNRDGHRLEPAFDFVADESSVLLHQSQAEIEIDGKHYAGDVEVVWIFCHKLTFFSMGDLRAYFLLM